MDWLIANGTDEALHYIPAGKIIKGG